MTDTEPAPMEPEPMEPEAMEPEAMEPEVADDKKPTATRAPVAKKPEGESGGGPDILQQLQTAQLQRIQLAVDFLTTPVCWNCHTAARTAREFESVLSLTD